MCGTREVPILLFSTGPEEQVKGLELGAGEGGSVFTLGKSECFWFMSRIGVVRG